jgi:ketosteroid isomerase-like protein
MNAREFADHWINAWNAHDLEQVLSHYADDFQMTSPYIAQIAGDASGTLKGKSAVGEYWEAALQRFPDLRFEHIATFEGVNAVAIHYKGPKGRLAVEVFRLNANGLVIEASAHYA